MDRRTFANPDAPFRPVPFWSWNDKLDITRLQQQIQAFADAGMGGFFMHARPGIRTPFLSDAWFAAVAASVDGAQKQGMQAWLYDECSYPSGFAGGFVPHNRPDLAQKWLRCQVRQPDTPAPAPPAALLAQFVLIDNPGGFLPYTGEDTSGHTVLQFVVETHQGTAWLNGAPYVDLLHPDSGREFIAAAYEPYAKRCADSFGSTIPGMFTDEPNVHPSSGGAVLPWTPNLPQEYRNRYGDDLLMRLPELFCNLGDFNQTRYRYWRLVAELFIENWMRPVYEWCDAHSLQFTGHLWEHVLAPGFSGSLMAPLEYMHIPGMDLLGQDNPQARLPQENGLPGQMGNVHMAKVVSSVAHQLGRSRVLSETYGGCGWDISFEAQKRYAEWEYALGVNLLNQHLSHYSLRGYRKHDYPISFMHYQPWWSRYRMMGDYFGRLSFALAQGQYRAQLLVLHPMASIWANWRPPVPAGAVDAAGVAGADASTGSTEQQMRLLEQTLERLTKALSAAGWDYDFGDDIIMERHAAVEQKAGQVLLQVGAMEYACVVLPACTNLASATSRLLEQFAAAGGAVYTLPPVPHQVDGQPADLQKLLAYATCAESPAQLVELLENAAAQGWLQRIVAVSTSTTAAPVYQLVRETTDAYVVFLVNVGDVAHLNETVWLRGSGPVERWDLGSGRSETLPTTPNGDGVEVVLDFAPAESHLLVHLKGANAEEHGSPTASDNQSSAGLQPTRTSALGRHLPKQVLRSVPLSAHWQFRRLDPNVLVLDRCVYRVGNEPWSAEVFTQEVACSLRQRYHLSTQPFRDVQPWVKHPDGPPVFPEMVAIKYSVQSQLAPPANLHLVVEDADTVSVVVNGEPVDVAKAGVEHPYWLDPAFRRIPIDHVWRRGSNVIELQFNFHEDLAVEPAFILGDFAVAGLAAHHPSLAPEPQTLLGGSWIGQGYPFYVGRGVYKQEITCTAADLENAVWLDCSNLPNIAAVRCNGQDAGIIAWQPYRVELTKRLRPGINTIEIEVANSLHNALGPMHAATLPGIIGPWSYTYTSNWVTDYRLVPDGIADQMQLLLAVPE